MELVQGSIRELQKKLSFEHIPQIIFKTEELKAHLLTEGKKQLDKGLVKKEHLENGKLYKEKIEVSYIPKVSVRFINEKVGHGLFLEEDLDEGMYFGEYVGLIRKNNDRLFISNYLHAYPVLDDIGRNYVIDAHIGCLTRFINHSYEPCLNTNYAFIDGFYHMILITKAPLKKGTQVTFNYGRNYWYTRTPPEQL